MINDKTSDSSMMDREYKCYDGYKREDARMNNVLNYDRTS